MHELAAIINGLAVIISVVDVVAVSIVIVTKLGAGVRSITTTAVMSITVHHGGHGRGAVVIAARRITRIGGPVTGHSHGVLGVI